MRLLISLLLVTGCGAKDERKRLDPATIEAASAICVAGTQADCTTVLDARWSGRKCCFPAVMTCVAGTSKQCRHESGGWTGSQCCFSGGATCTSGTPDACQAASGVWTGAQCCVPSTFSCAAGSADACVGKGTKWTGTDCCSRRK
ncbi:hypothetical protein BH11MYX1_BH11MYX1_07990 [soil metagenome]